MSAKSETGSPVPVSVIRPDESIPADASTICNNASDCAAIERNWLPKPLPFHASLINPGKSINSIGMYLQPSLHFELLGLSWTLNSLWTQSVIACPIEVDGFLVVNGYVEISSVDKVSHYINLLQNSNKLLAGSSIIGDVSLLLPM